MSKGSSKFSPRNNVDLCSLTSPQLASHRINMQEDNAPQIPRDLVSLSAVLASPIMSYCENIDTTSIFPHPEAHLCFADLDQRHRILHLTRCLRSKPAISPRSPKVFSCRRKLGLKHGKDSNSRLKRVGLPACCNTKRRSRSAKARMSRNNYFWMETPAYLAVRQTSEDLPIFATSG